MTGSLYANGSHLQVRAALTDQEGQKLHPEGVSTYIYVLVMSDEQTLLRTPSCSDDSVAHIIRGTIAHSREPHHGSQGG